MLNSITIILSSLLFYYGVMVIVDKLDSIIKLLKEIAISLREG